MERYLVGIYGLTNEGKIVRIGELVKFFNVAPGTNKHCQTVKKGRVSNSPSL